MKKYVKNESGALMLEGMIVFILTVFVLIWILGIGFLYYQKYTVRIITNDAAEKIANTYKSKETDIITGYVSRSDVINRSIFGSKANRAANEARCQSYVNYMLDKANFYNTVKDVKVSVQNEPDIMGRSHVKVTTVCTFNTPFGEGLELFGMSGTNTYMVTAYADSTDLSQYVSAVTTTYALTNGSIVPMPSIVTSTVRMVQSLMNMTQSLPNMVERLLK